MAGMNSHIHLMIKTSLLNEIKRKAKDKGLCLSEYCRQMLRGDSQLDKIEKMIKRILK